jgi:hypothetical protein
MEIYVFTRLTRLERMIVQYAYSPLLHAIYVMQCLEYAD